MMFNNPNFQQPNEINTPQTSKNDSRLSVQEIISKYDNTNRKSNGEIRFTFQTELKKNQSPDRGTFGTNQTQGYKFSVGQKQNIQNIDESNLSKVLSEFSIQTDSGNLEEPKENQIFTNPIGLRMDQNNGQQAKNNYPQQERITFGQQFQNQFVQQLKQQDDILNTIEVSHNKSYVDEEDLYDDMSVLRDKVLGLLQAYSNDIKSDKKTNNVRSRIKEDASKISKEYSQILTKVNQTDVSAFTNISQDISQMETPNQKQKELDMMFNLVEQFLNKFQQQPELNYSRIKESKIQQDQPQININHSKALREQTNQESKPLDITVMPNFPSAEDSFYQKPSIPVDKLGMKLLNLKEKLQKELEQAELHYTKKILSEMIQNLNEILSANDTQTVKTVVYRIEEGIKNLNQNDQGCSNLYNYINKALKATKKKLNEITDQGQVEKQRKRKFFDISLKYKSNLPDKHPGKQVMVSILYDDFLQEKISDDQMEQYIKKRLQL